MLHILAQTPIPQPDEFFATWYVKGGILGVFLGMFVWIFTRYGPNALSEFRKDVSALAESNRTHVRELVEGFHKAMTEKEAKHALECTAYRDLITEMSDKFSQRLEENERRVTEMLREERERCRQDRAADWERFKELMRGNNA